jgi:hypothetical protein
MLNNNSIKVSSWLLPFEKKVAPKKKKMGGLDWPLHPKKKNLGSRGGADFSRA